MAIQLGSPLRELTGDDFLHSGLGLAFYLTAGSCIPCGSCSGAEWPQCSSGWPPKAHTRVLFRLEALGGVDCTQSARQQEARSISRDVRLLVQGGTALWLDGMVATQINSWGGAKQV